MAEMIYTEQEFAIQIAEARVWVRDCLWTDLDAEDVEDLAPMTIVRGVERFYAGGWDAFLAECVTTYPLPRRVPGATLLWGVPSA